MLMIPYVATLAWTGRLELAENIEEPHRSVFSKDGAVGTGQNSDGNMRTVIIERNEKQQEIPVEEFLVHVIAAQIPADFEQETLNAQAVLARTYVYGLMDGRKEIREEELDIDALSMEQMIKLWGEKEYAANLGKLQTAVKETEGLYILYDGAMIEPLFCYASAGTTRSRGDEFPYLKQTESPWDLLAKDYRSLPVFEWKEFVKRVNEIPGAVEVRETELAHGDGIQIVERDGAGYVKQVQIGQKTYSGEEVQYALGLASSCYSFERLDGKIRVICKGIGHGYGFSQFGANEMAKEGKTYEELLKYYFQNVEIVGI